MKNKIDLIISENKDISTEITKSINWDKFFLSKEEPNKNYFLVIRINHCPGGVISGGRIYTKIREPKEYLIERNAILGFIEKMQGHDRLIEELTEIKLKLTILKEQIVFVKKGDRKPHPKYISQRLESQELSEIISKAKENSHWLINLGSYHSLIENLTIIRNCIDNIRNNQKDYGGANITNLMTLPPALDGIMKISTIDSVEILTSTLAIIDSIIVSNE